MVVAVVAVGTWQAMLADIRRSIDSLRSELLPRKKFAFRGKTGKGSAGDSGAATTPLSTPDVSDAGGAATTAGAAATATSGISSTSAEDMTGAHAVVGVTGGEVHVVPGQLTEGQDIILENLTDVVVVMYVRGVGPGMMWGDMRWRYGECESVSKGACESERVQGEGRIGVVLVTRLGVGAAAHRRDSARAIRCSNIVNCHLYVGPVPGSVLLYNCSNCVFFFAARQARVLVCWSTVTPPPHTHTHEVSSLPFFRVLSC